MSNACQGVFSKSLEFRGDNLIFEKISALCKEKGFSVASLEKAAGLGNATIRGWKSGSPSVSNLKRVADVLNCTVDELLKED